VILELPVASSLAVSFLLQHSAAGVLGATGAVGRLVASVATGILAVAGLPLEGPAAVVPWQSAVVPWQSAVVPWQTSGTGQEYLELLGGCIGGRGLGWCWEHARRVYCTCAAKTVVLRPQWGPRWEPRGRPDPPRRSRT